MIDEIFDNAGFQPPHRREAGRIRHWLKSGWADYRARPFLAVGYGLGFALVSWTLVGLLWLLDLEWMLLPALSGALLVGPLVAVGLYKVSAERLGRRLPKIAAPGQIALAGCILMILLLAWIRAATLLYALFFGLKPFPGFWETMETLLFSVEGWGLLGVGTLVGGLFAALAFAVSVYAIPMLVRREIDAFSAMGRSFSAAAHSLPLTLRWGAVVTGLACLGFATGMVGMILVFPLLGFATWHAYEDVFGTN